MSIKRLTEDEFFARVNFLYEQFHTRPEMQGISFEEFKNECLEEFKKQNLMSDEQLKQYRNQNYNDIIEQVNKLTTKEEKQKLNEQDSRTISAQEEMISNVKKNL